MSWLDEMEIFGWFCFLGPVVFTVIELIVALCSEHNPCKGSSDFIVPSIGDPAVPPSPPSQHQPTYHRDYYDTQTEFEKAVFGESLLSAASDLLPGGGNYS